MLEHAGLLVLPWARPPASSAPPAAGEATCHARRAILSPTTQAPLGFACRRDAAGCGLLRYFLGPAPVLSVHETEDEPLLFTVHRRRPAWLGWQARDADGRLVGALWRARVPFAAGEGLPGRTHGRHARRWATVARDPLGRLFVVRDLEPGPDPVTLWTSWPSLAPAWREVGTCAARDGGVLVRFGAELGESPFARMLLLAAVLVW